MPIVLDAISGRLYLAPPVTPTGSLATAVFAMTPVRNIVAPGDVTLSKPAPLNRHVTHRVNLGASVNPANLILPLADAIEGDVAHLRVAFPAASGSVITVRDATTGGTLLATLTSTGQAFVQSFDFSFNGTGWEPEETLT